MATALGLGLSVALARSASGGGGGEATQRIADVDFDTGTGWAGAEWTIAAGSATNNTAGQFLVATLSQPILADQNVVVLVNVLANPSFVTWMLTLYNTSTLTSQSVISDSSGDTGGIPGSVVANGTYDAVRIRALADPGLTLDSVSVLA